MGGFRLRYAIAALLVYVVLLGVLIYYFAKAPEKKPKRFVEKNEKPIAVSLSTPKASSQTAKPKPAMKKPQPKAKPKPAPKPKPSLKAKKTPEKKPAKKQRRNLSENRPKPTPKKNQSPKKPDTKTPSATELFNNVKTVQKKPKKASVSKANARQKDPKYQGIENAYLAKVEKVLHGWPAQSEFAGKKATVWLKIDPNGKFVFKLSKPSEDMAFNKALIAYLEQLQAIGFGPHQGSKPYRIEVDFVAKE